MLSLINNEVNNNKILSLLSRKKLTMEHIKLVDVSDKVDAALLKLEDGSVYYYERIYVFANRNEQIQEIIIVDNGELGVTSIRSETLKFSKNKELVNTLKEFVSVLYHFFKYLEDKNSLKCNKYPNSIFEIREYVLTKHNIKEKKNVKETI